MWGGEECCLSRLNPNINKQIVQTGLFENNLFHDQSIYSIVIFLTIVITFSFYDVVMMLGENLCWSLKVHGGRGGFMIREVTLAYVNRDTTTVVSQIKWSQSFKKSVKLIYIVLARAKSEALNNIYSLFTKT